MGSRNPKSEGDLLDVPKIPLGRTDSVECDVPKAALGRLDFIHAYSKTREDSLRKMVRSTVEESLQSFTLSSVSSTSREHSDASGSLQLHFVNQGQSFKTIFTGTSLQDHGILLKVVLKDDSGSIVKDGPLSSMNVQIVVLDSDFSSEDGDDLTGKNFEHYVLEGRQKQPLLEGNCVIPLENGVADINEIMFTDNSEWVRSNQFRLGAKVVKTVSDGVTIKEAISEAFKVKGRRGETHKNKQTPDPTDEVWRLYHIAKNGKIHTRLEKANIHTVNDLLQVNFANPDKLKKILQVSNKKFEAIVKHAASSRTNIKLLEDPIGDYRGKDSMLVEYENPKEEIGIWLPNYQESSSIDTISPFTYSNPDTFVDFEAANLGVRLEDDRWVMQITELVKPRRWKILSLVLFAITKMRSMIVQVPDKKFASHTNLKLHENPIGDYRGKDSMLAEYENPNEQTGIWFPNYLVSSSIDTIAPFTYSNPDTLLDYAAALGVRLEDDRLIMQIPELVKPSRWKILSLVLCAITKMRSMVREKYDVMMLYCLLFGVNYEFEREKVIQLWMAVGFLKEEPLEENGNRIFNILMDKYYIIPSDVSISRRTRLFKVNFELVSSVIDSAKAIERFDMRIEDADVMGNYILDSWHISVQSSNINLTTLRKFNMLRTLLFLNCSFPTQVASDFFCTFKVLTALDLSGSCIREIPSSIQDVTELRYVDFSWTKISRLPQSIVQLHKLQTLRLKGCMDLFELPQRMKELINLRHLDFDVLGQLILMPRGIGHLTELRTLTAFIVDGEIINGEKCCNIEELKYMNNLSGQLCISGLEELSSEDAKEAALIDKKFLKHLELRWVDIIEYIQEEELVTVLEGLKPNSCLEELKITCFPGKSLPNWIGDTQYQNLRSIILFKCEHCTKLPYLGQLPKLKNLEIVEMNAVEQIDYQFCGDDDDCAAFPLLEKLIIDGMNRVEVITNGNFTCLLRLSMNRCPNLTTLCSFPRCPSLKWVEITDCPLLKYLPEEIVSSPLESLVIDACPLLRDTYSKGGLGSCIIEHMTNVWIGSEGTQSSSEYSTEDDSSMEDDMLEEDD